MTQSFSVYSRSLWLSASVLAILVAGPASAQTTVLTSSSGNYDLVSQAGTDQYVEVSSGTDAYLIRGNSNGSSNSGNPVATTGGVDILYTIGDGWKNGIGAVGSGAGSSDLGWFYAPSNAPAIKVDSGAILTVAGKETTGSSEEYYFYGMFQGGGGEVRFGEGKWTLWGSNSFTDLTLLNNAKLRFGGIYESWSCCGGGTSGSNTVSGWLAGALTSILQLDGGSLTMNGVDTAANAYLGTVNVNSSGTFTVGDSSHSDAVFGDPTGNTAQINVNGTGILSGYGTIDGNVTSSGVIKAGGTSGVNGNLTINGNVTLTDNSVLKTSISPTGASGLVINGDLAAGGEMDIDVTSGTYGNGVYEVLVVNGGSMTGSFNKVVTTGSTGDVIAGLKQTSSGYTIVTEKSSSPQVYGHVVYANRMAVTNFVGSLYDAMATTPASGAMLDTWIAPIGQIENLSREGQGYDQKTYGVSLGALHRFENHGGVIGGAFSYRHGNMKIKDDPATASSNGYDLAVFGGAEVNNVRFEGSVFYNFYSADTKRPMGGTYGTSQADQNGYTYGFSGQISRDLFHGWSTPYVRAMYARTHLEAATETGSLQYDLAHEAISANTFVTDLGIRVHLLRPQPDRKIKIDADVAWRYDLSDPGETLNVSFANFTSGNNVYYWRGDSKHALVAGVDVAGQVTGGLEIYGRLGGTLTSHRREGDLTAGVKYKF